jgi:hypothetical protein
MQLLGLDFNEFTSCEMPYCASKHKRVVNIGSLNSTTSDSESPHLNIFVNVGRVTPRLPT